MAKTPATEEPKTVTVGSFTFDMGLPVPAAARSPGKASEDDQKLLAMPVGASYLEPVTVPDAIKDPAEREKAFKENQKTTNNRLSGRTRRFAKKHEGYQFALRLVNDDVLGRGVRVYRVAVEPAVAPAA